MKTNENLWNLPNRPFFHHVHKNKTEGYGKLETKYVNITRNNTENSTEFYKTKKFMFLIQLFLRTCLRDYQATVYEQTVIDQQVSQRNQLYNLT